jgi:zinc D-Ala-D-Ala carboxypeptidase
MQISKHLNLAEVTRSESAKRLGISNTPTPEHLDNFKVLAEKVFEPIREHFKVPIHISSGYRSKELNQAIKGSLTSQHCEGKAIDIDMDGSDISNSDVFKYIKDNLIFDQLIWEFGGDNNPDWVHVSYNDGKNRKQVLKAQKIKGKATYIPYK